MSLFQPEYQIEPLLKHLGYNARWNHETKRTWIKDHANFAAARKVALQRRGIGPVRWRTFLAALDLREEVSVVDLRMEQTK